ncbi:hypothetical protein [Iningainema tapete]|uniref:Uncharacterized protein n=1 Tax=Iningainema tapete BLCC-T55 TaxID=2748662 RepID=A0A8J6XRB6_9CYAN|nr:hypothetical protein [Iningainema tapete]MBD2778137.1 hypothetical protein [Iningainema tapete BLCC-T55]
MSRSRPNNLVLIDVAMGTMNGLEATRLQKAQPNPIYVAIFTLNNYGLAPLRESQKSKVKSIIYQGFCAILNGIFISAVTY